MLPEKVQAARLRLVKQYPFLATALWAVIPVERPGLNTLAVDRWWRLYFDLQAVDRWTVEELSAVLYHEICHLLRDHPLRFETLVRIIANIATDVEINDDIRSEVQLPKGAIYPETFGLEHGKFAEEYYEVLMRTAQPKAAGDADGNEGGSAEDPGPSQATTAVSSSSTGDGSKSTDPLSSDPPASSDPSGSHVANSSDTTGHGKGCGAAPSQPFPKCGSCAHGQQEPWEEAPPGKSTVPGITQGEAEVIRRKVAESITQRVRVSQQSKNLGTVPEHWQRWAEQKLRPKVDWRRELAALIRRAVAAQSGAHDYTYRKPSKRSPPDIILPSLYQPVPEVAVVVDTSGSMSDDEIAQALAEVAGILQAMGYKHSVTVLSVDAEVHTCHRVFRPEQVRLVGGGGTDMGVGLAAALSLRPRPSVVVVVTDGITPWPTTPPNNTNVVVVLVDEEGDPPDWAKTIKVEV